MKATSSPGTDVFAWHKLHAGNVFGWHKLFFVSFFEKKRLGNLHHRSVPNPVGVPILNLDYTLAHPKADDLTAEMGWNPVPSPHETS